MAQITDTRHYNERTPAHVAVSRWLDAKYVSIEGSGLSETEEKLAYYRFAPVSINDIWVENAKPTLDVSGNGLVSFSIRKRGFIILDAIVKLITINDIITFYEIPVKTFSTYTDLFKHIKSNKDFSLYKVAESADGKYGLLDDTSLPEATRYSNFIKALGDVKMDVITSYEDRSATLSSPVVGTIAFSHGTLKSFTMELYHYTDILNT